MIRERSLRILMALVFLTVVEGAQVHAQSRSRESARRETETSRQIAEKQKELDKLRAEIQEYEKSYNKKEKDKKSTLANISYLEQQVGRLQKLIKKLREQEQNIRSDIQETRTSIQELERQLEGLKGHYAKYVRSVYKFGRVYDLELLFSSNSINQLYIRIEYLKRFSEQRARDMREIGSKKGDLEAENDRLQVNLMHERNLLAEKTSAESTFKKKVTEHRKSLTSIQKDMSKLKEMVEERRRSAEAINRLIAKLNDEEKRRKEMEAARSKERGAPALKPTPEPETAVGAFAAQRGRLRWPVSAGTIASRFGRQVHPILKTVRENTGVDIQVRRGTPVQAVADGEVSILTFIPGFGNIMILSHGDGYRTVYAHLSEINVVESQKVRAGEAIAKSGEAVEGQILHFEVWKGTTKQDPELWLAKQR